MRRSRLTFPLILFVALTGFYCKEEKLTDQTIDRYVKAYGNLAGKSAALKEKLGGATDGKQCKDCQPILEEAARQAGFADYDAFIDEDGRIRSAVGFIQMKETLGKAQEGMGKMTDEAACMQMMASQSDLSEAEKKDKCSKMKKGMGVAQGAMGAVGSVMEFFAEKEDVEAVRPHVAKIDQAINNKALACQFDFACPEKNLNLNPTGE